jgi:hypothetical protein
MINHLLKLLIKYLVIFHRINKIICTLNPDKEIKKILMSLSPTKKPIPKYLPPPAIIAGIKCLNHG